VRGRDGARRSTGPDAPRLLPRQRSEEPQLTGSAIQVQGILQELSENGASETRTRDLLGAIQALSQLSYSPVRRRDAARNERV
jgi:hypothetical protein